MLVKVLHRLLAAVMAITITIRSTLACARSRTTAAITRARHVVGPHIVRIDRLRRTFGEHPLPSMAVRVPKATKRALEAATVTYAAMLTGIVPPQGGWIVVSTVAVVGWHFYKALREKAVVDAAEPLWDQLKTAWTHP